jgi:hypothetical protein
MKEHSILSSQESMKTGKYHVPVKDVELTFSHYKCFVCKDDRDHETVISFLSHWLITHPETSTDGSGVTFICSVGSDWKKQCCVRGDVLMTGILELAQHLAKEHDQPLPTYIVPIAEAPIYSFELNSEGQSVMTKKTSLETKASNDRFPLEVFEQYPSFSPGVVELPFPGVRHLHDRQMTLLEPKCFLCDDNSFRDISTTKRHWCMDHFVPIGDNVFAMQCPLCSHTFKLSKKVTPSTASELVASLGVHLYSQHNYKFPDYVVSSPCPLSKCPRVFYNIFQYRQHIRSHNIEIADLVSGKYTVPRNIIETFIEYKCFLCDDDVDLLSVIAYINHWLAEHFVDKNQLPCPVCMETSILEGLRADAVLNLVIRLAEHLSNQHGKEMPPYITEGEVTTSTTEEVVIYHQPLSDANIKLFSLTPEKRLQMLQFACFACVDEPEFCTEESLLAHWSDKHSAKGI